MAKKARIWKPNGKSVNASDVYSKIPFFCNTENCDAEMVIVSIVAQLSRQKSEIFIMN